MTFDDFLNFDNWAMRNLPGILAYPIQVIWILMILTVIILLLLVMALAALIVPPEKVKSWWRDNQ